MRAMTMVMAAALAATALTACTRIRNNQGYIVDEQLVTAIQPGIDNRESVTKTLGRPTFTSQFDNREWYYVSRNTAQLAFLTPRPAAQSLVIVSFKPDGAVEKVTRRGLEKVVAVSPEGDKTPTLGREGGILEDLFGSLGRGGQPTGGGQPPQ